jgi:hypothetical protein
MGHGGADRTSTTTTNNKHKHTRSLARLAPAHPTPLTSRLHQASTTHRCGQSSGPNGPGHAGQTGHQARGTWTSCRQCPGS